MRRWLAAALAALAALALLAPAAQAHELSMTELSVRELGGGDFSVQWGAGEKAQPADHLRPQWPAHCRAEGTLLRCGDAGLKGTVAIEGVGQRFSAVLLKVNWREGGPRAYTLTANQPAVQLFGSADDQRGFGEVAAAYGVLGVEHILSGFDHLLFVLGLLFLVGLGRRLVWTLTAFTAAHSLTLALSATGWLVLRPAPVEACIALSILLVAGEALQRRETLARRWPALVAFLFGLVHGLGFAGALKEIGLPENHLAVALLAFNAGVEAGQLLVVGAAALLVLALRRWPARERLRAPVLYAIGGLAAYWTIARVALLAA